MAREAISEKKNLKRKDTNLPNEPLTVWHVTGQGESGDISVDFADGGPGAGAQGRRHLGRVSRLGPDSLVKGKSTNYT